MLKFIPFAIVIAFLILLVLFARRSATSSQSASKIEPKQITGTWLLKTMGGKEPSGVGLKSYEITFSVNGEVEFVGITLADVEVRGSGTWKIENDVFDYKIGENEGRSKVGLQGRVLSFSPDPVLLDNGNKAASTFVRK